MKFNTLSILEKIEIKRYIVDLVENGAEDEFDEIFDDFVKLTNIDRDDAAELFNKELGKNYDGVVVGTKNKKVVVPGGHKLYENLEELEYSLQKQMANYSIDIYDRKLVISMLFSGDTSYNMVVINKQGQFYLEEVL